MKISSKITVLGLQERLSLLYDIMNYDDIGNYNFEFYKNDSRGQLCFTTHNLEPINIDFNVLCEKCKFFLQNFLHIAKSAFLCYTIY